MTRRLLVLPVLLCLLALAGCSDLQGTDGKQYVTGDGAITLIPEEERGEPIEASGTTVGGDALDLADRRGQVVVVNVWGSWCPPCREEMPTLVELDAELDPADASVVGINVRDNSQATAQSFERNYQMDFPSFYDPGASEVLIRFADEISPRAIPSTAILDRQGRIAAIVLGKVPGAVTMTDIIADIAAEEPAPGGGSADG